MAKRPSGAKGSPLNSSSSFALCFGFASLGAMRVSSIKTRFVCLFVCLLACLFVCLFVCSCNFGGGRKFVCAVLLFFRRGFPQDNWIAFLCGLFLRRASRPRLFRPGPQQRRKHVFRSGAVYDGEWMGPKPRFLRTLRAPGVSVRGAPSDWSRIGGFGFGPRAVVEEWKTTS